MKNILLPIVFFFALTSCEKIINVKLKDSDKKIVIDAKIYEGTNDVIVKITKTANYFNGTPETINSANVILTDNLGNATTINSIGDGMYKFSNYNAVANVSYQLDVNVDNKHFNASAFMPPHVNIDTLTYVLSKDNKGDSIYTVNEKLLDPKGIKNYYRQVITVNNEYKNTPADLNINNDGFVDGNEIEVSFYTAKYSATKTYTLDTELLTMDENVYTYFATLYSIINDGNSIAPANPTTNITGGALGVFAAYGRAKKTIIIN